MSCRLHALLALLVWCIPQVVLAQSSDDLFNPGTVHELRLFINSRDLNELRERFLENTYYPADLQWGDLRMRNVGVRSRGYGSRYSAKLGLRVDFNRYVTGQRFLGLASIVLDNLTQDPSMIRERAALAFIAHMGQPASRTSFARLYINDELEGVYAIVEPIDQSYLARTLGDTKGYLFEYHWLRPYYFEDLGDELAAYEPMFEPRTHETAPPVTLYSAIREIVRPMDASNPTLWREQAERYVDLRQFVTIVAIEQFLSEQDGLTGYDGVNNFYLYRPADSDRHLVLPWDRDNSFQQIDSSVFQRIEENYLLRRTLMFADLRALYDNTLEACVKAALQDAWLEREIARDAALVAPHAREDQRKPYNDEEHAEAVAFLLEFARGRSAVVTAQLTQARAGTRRAR